MRRFFVSPQAIDGDSVVLSGSQAHHLRTVLRLHSGDIIEIFDGTGALYRIELCEITETTVQGCIRERRKEELEVPFPLTLAQGILKGKKMDLVLQKATELGVDTLIPVLSRYCQQHKSIDRRMQRWHRVMLESCKQCGRSIPMIISPVIALQDLPVSAFQYHIFCWEKEEQEVASPQLFTASGKTLLLIGPEGGFHDQEVQWARYKGFHTMTLGSLVLRAETAAIVAIGIIQYLSRLQGTRLQD